MTKLVLAEEFIERLVDPETGCYDQWVNCSFDGIVRNYPGHSMEEYRDAFIGLLERWLKEGRICLFAPLALRRRDGTFDTKVRKIPGYWELWDIPHDEMIAWTREHWPDDITDPHDSELHAYFYTGRCPAIGWYNPETGEIDSA